LLNIGIDKSPICWFGHLKYGAYLCLFQYLISWAFPTIRDEPKNLLRFVLLMLR
jgi:hypothetical protein